MSEDAKDIFLRLGSASPAFPHRCVVCGAGCAHEFESVIASKYEQKSVWVGFFGRTFTVPMHAGVCRNRFERTWLLWQWHWRNFVAVYLVGFLSTIPLYFVTDNLYVIFAIGLGIPAGLTILAVIGRDRSPLKIYELGDGWRHEFSFQSEAYAREFAQMNSSYLAAD